MASPAVDVLLGEKASRLRSAPKSGRMTRSPLDVPRMIRIDSCTNSSYLEIATLFASTWTGNFQPTPRKACSAIISPQPISTVPTATMVPPGRSDGSLQVIAVSLLRAAILPLIFTVGLPTLIVALFDGEAWKGPP